MHPGNDIHPSCIIGERVLMGIGNQILPNTIILGPISIGDNNIIGPNVVIGVTGGDSRNPRYDSSDCPIEIGSNNIIREFTAIQKPAYTDITRLGSNNFLMQSLHIPHDVQIDDDVVVSPHVALGGHSHVMRGANVGMGANVHQFTVIGACSMVAMGSAVVKNVKPFSKFIPGKPLTVNSYAIRKFGLTDIEQEIHAYVLESAAPVSETFKAMINAFEKLHGASGRKLYE